MKIHFYGCEHLDFESDFSDCTKELIQHGGGQSVFWMREVVDPELPSMVQFCKNRGRMNNPCACLSNEEARCFDYKEKLYSVDV
jgi:hypothetical protein